MVKKIKFDPGAVLDRVISSGTNNTNLLSISKLIFIEFIKLILKFIFSLTPNFEETIRTVCCFC